MTMATPYGCADALVKKMAVELLKAEKRITLSLFYKHKEQQANQLGIDVAEQLLTKGAGAIFGCYL